MATKLNENHYISLGLALTVFGAVAAGGFAWGQMDERVKKLEEATPTQDEAQKQLHELDSNQRLLIFKQEKAEEEQKEFRDETKRALEAILMKLDER